MTSAGSRTAASWRSHRPPMRGLRRPLLILLRTTYIATVLVISGCVRVDFNSPSVSGRVIDSVAGTPVNKAVVLIKERPKVNFITGGSGEFTLPPIRETSLTLPVADMIHLGCCFRGVIAVEASGFKLLEHRIQADAPDEIEVLLELENE